jgi:hypothetical protein
MNGNMNNTKELSVGRIVLVLLLSISSASIFVTIFRLMPGFIETFASFGYSLPLPTKTVLNLYPVYPVMVFVCLLPSVIVFIKRVSLNVRIKMLPLSLAFILAAIVYFVFMLWALYLPAFELGSQAK